MIVKWNGKETFVYGHNGKKLIAIGIGETKEVSDQSYDILKRKFGEKIIDA